MKELREQFKKEFNENPLYPIGAFKESYVEWLESKLKSIQPQTTVTDELKRLILICEKEGGNQAYAHLYFELRGVLDKLQQPQEQRTVSKMSFNGKIVYEKPQEQKDSELIEQSQIENVLNNSKKIIAQRDKMIKQLEARIKEQDIYIDKLKTVSN